VSGELSERQVGVAARAAARQARVLGRIADAYDRRTTPGQQRARLLADIQAGLDSGQHDSVMANQMQQVAQRLITELQQPQGQPGGAPGGVPGRPQRAAPRPEGARPAGPRPGGPQAGSPRPLGPPPPTALRG